MKYYDEKWNDECGLTLREKVDFAEIVFHETRTGASERISRQLVEFSDNPAMLTMWADTLWPSTLWREGKSHDDASVGG